MGATVEIKGLREASELLRKLGHTDMRRTMLRVLRKGAKPIVKSIRRHVPSSDSSLKKKGDAKPGDLKRSVGLRAARKKDKHSTLLVIGYRIGGNLKGYHGHLVESGHKTRSGGFVKGQHVLLRAFQKSKRPAINDVVKGIGPEIIKQIKKMAKV